jgi:hypothetical protein
MMLDCDLKILIFQGRSFGNVKFGIHCLNSCLKLSLCLTKHYAMKTLGECRIANMCIYGKSAFF